MSLVVMIVIGFILLPILFGIYFFKKLRLASYVCFAIPLVLFLLIGSYVVYMKNYHFVNSTNLQGETLAHLTIGQSFSEDVKTSLGPFTWQDNGLFPNAFKSSDNLFIGADKSNQIQLISSDSINEETLKGLKVGDDVAKMIQLYGKHCTSGSNDSPSYVYVDRGHNLLLECFYYGHKINRIQLRSKDL